MTGLAVLLMIVGGIAAFAGGIWLIVLAFQESVLWGLGSIFVPFVSLIFAIMHWEKAKKPFLIAVFGTVLLIAGLIMGGSAIMGPENI